MANMSRNSPYHQMTQRMITSDVDCATEMKFKTEHTQTAKKALMDMLTTGNAVTTSGLKDVPYSYIENILTETTRKGTLDGLFIRNPEHWSQAPEFVGAFRQRVFNLRTFTNPLDTCVKQRMDSTVDEWRLDAKKETHTTEGKPYTVVPPTQPETYSSKDLEDLVRQIFEPVHSRKQRAKNLKDHDRQACPFIVYELLLIKGTPYPHWLSYRF